MLLLVQPPPACNSVCYDIDNYMCSPVCRIVPRDGYLSITSGMWAGYELSVTRALGHKHLAAHGVTPVPYVNVVHLRGDECCLVRSFICSHVAYRLGTPCKQCSFSLKLKPPLCGLGFKCIWLIPGAAACGLPCVQLYVIL